MKTVQDLVDAFRDDEKDAAGDGSFWSEGQLVRWANQAVDRYCEITRSVYDSSSSFTTLSVNAGDSEFCRHDSIIDIVSASILPPNKRDLNIEAPGQTPFSCLPTSGMTKLLVVDTKTLRLYPPAATDCTLQMQVIRRSLRTLEIESRLDDVPRHARETLLLYMKHRAYRVNDAEMFDPAKSANFLAEFEGECQTHYETAQAARRPGRIKSDW